MAEAGAVGIGDGRILLAVVPRAGQTLDSSKLSLELADTLPPHQRPDVIVVAESLPHAEDASGGPGKLLRREIREKYQHLVD
ncbi:hypothetical protein GCM10020219_068670 [Nonomuraea dietziae]